MANSKKKCKCHGEYKAAENLLQLPAGMFCSRADAISWANKKSAAKAQEKKLKSQRINEDFKNNVLSLPKAKQKEYLRSRTEWYDKLQSLVNQYILHIRDFGEPCCTCGKTTESVKYDAGHFLTRGAHKELRFELTNIHKQCSVNCNQHGSGMRPEYEVFIINKYGKDHLDWLKGPHKTLKEQYPHIDDIKQDILKFRKMIRAAGLQPYC